MQKITPHLWFNDQAEEAVKFYASIFKNSRILNTARYGEAAAKISGRPKGSVMTIEFEILGQKFMALNGGPIFKFTPAASFFVACKTKEEVVELWNKLSKGGKPLMELGEYPFSEKYGWVEDRYGLSWQVMFVDNREIKQKITPTLMFVGDVSGKAEEAINFYASVFHNSKVGDIMRYGKSQEPDKEGTIAHATFTLEGQEFAAMESAREHKFSFNEAISFMVYCDTQEEIDYYWTKLSAIPAAEQCGWLKDKYGVSWQIVPSVLDKMLQDKEARERVMNELLKMKKIDIEALKKAYEQEPKSAERVLVE